MIRIRKNLVRVKGGELVFKDTKTVGSVRDVKVPSFVMDVLREHSKATWKGNGQDWVFVNKRGNVIHRHTLNQTVIRPALLKIGFTTAFTLKDTRASYITNSIDQGERISFVQKNVGHITPRMIVQHYYRHLSAEEDGLRLEEAWNSTRIVPDPGGPGLQPIENKR